MSKMIKSAALALSLSLALVANGARAGVETTEAAKVPAGRYEVDPSHAQVVARVNHLGFSTTTVRFPKISGALTYDPAHPEAATVDVTIDTAALTSDWEARDKELRGPGFFNSAAFPEARFTARSLAVVDGHTARVMGEMTLLGVTRPVEFAVDLIGSGKGMMGDGRIGLVARAKINRSDFGMKAFLPAVGDAVEIIVDAEFTRK